MATSVARDGQGGSNSVSGDEDVEGLIEELQLLTVPGAAPVGHDLDLSGVSGFESAQFRLGEHFRTHPQIERVNLIVRGRNAGVASRESTTWDAGQFAGDAPAAGSPAAAGSAGSGEGLQLPGYSTRYRLLEFTCAQPTSECDSEYRVHYDERDIPACGHGRMELRR